MAENPAGCPSLPVCFSMVFTVAYCRQFRSPFIIRSIEQRKTLQGCSLQRVHWRFLGLPATGLHLRLPHLGHTQPPGKRRRMSASSHDPSSPYLATQDRRSPSPPSAASTILALRLAMPRRPFP